MSGGDSMHRVDYLVLLAVLIAIASQVWESAFEFWVASMVLLGALLLMDFAFDWWARRKRSRR